MTHPAESSYGQLWSTPQTGKSLQGGAPLSCWFYNPMRYHVYGVYTYVLVRTYNISTTKSTKNLTANLVMKHCSSVVLKLNSSGAGAPEAAKPGGSLVQEPMIAYG